MTKPDSKIPLVVCEYHQEVLRYIHRLIAQKKFPFNGIKMVHFDSHPDLAYPERLSADDVYKKEIMYNELDIADWILPLMYAGHIDHLVWVKPPWANQIPEKKLNFSVGKEIASGFLKVTCTEDYFVEDCCYSSRSNLSNTKDVVVESVQMKTFKKQFATKDIVVNGTKQCAEKTNDNAHLASLEDSECNGNVENRRKRNCNNPYDKLDEKKARSEHRVDKSSLDSSFSLDDQKYILDIDLDFFSVMNPFIQDYSEEHFQILKDTYAVSPPLARDEEALQAWTTTTRKKHSNLARLIDLVKTKTDTSDVKTEQNKAFIEMLEDLRDGLEDNDWELVHNAGMSMGVPHHISSEQEIDDLVAEMVDLLKMMPTPTAITVARSTIDEYCPMEQIEMIQDKVLNALKSVYSDESLAITYDYKID